MADTPHSPSPTTVSTSNGVGRIVLNAGQIRAAISRMSAEILLRNPDGSKLALIGLPTRGVTLAQRIASEIKQHTELEVPLGQIDITFHRDDLELRRPIPHVTAIPFDITDRTIILVDDVLYSGRSVRAALDALIDLGRPESIQLATLIDRGHRKLPIAADYVGEMIQTNYLDRVSVKVQEVDSMDAVEVRQS